MATSEHKALFKAEVEGTEELNQMKEATEGVSSGFRSMGDSADDAKSKTASLGDVMKRLESIDLQQKFQSIRGAVNDLSEAIGSAGTASGTGLISSFLQAGAAGAELGAMFGPQGAFVGGIIGAAIPALVALTSQEERAAQAANEHREAIMGVVAAMRAERAQSAMTVATRTGRFDPSVSTGAIETERDVLQAELDGVKQTMERLLASAARDRLSDDSLSFIATEGVFEGQDLREVQSDFEVRLNNIQSELRRRGVAESARARNAAENDPAWSGGGGGTREVDNTGTDFDAASTNALRELFAFDRFIDEGGVIPGAQGSDSGMLTRLLGDEDDIDEYIGSIVESFDEATNATKEMTDAQRELQEAAKAASDEFLNGWGRSTEEVIAAFEAANEAAEKAGQVQFETGRLIAESASAVGEQVLESIGGDISKAFAASVVAAIEGAKSFEEVMAGMVKSILESLLQEAIVQALRETALAIGDIASYKYDSAAAHFAAAGAWVAVGAAAGAGLGAVAASGGGGGGSASAASNAPQENQEAQQTQSITINMTYNNPMYTTQNDADRQLREALNRVNLGR
jgi:hypothetical protein